LRIDAITHAHGSNVERVQSAESHGSNGASFREVLVSVRSERAHASADTRWSAADTEAFAVFAEANRRTESGGVAEFSTLRTSAGASHRASFGVAQLSVREHLDRLATEPDARLTTFGTTRSELDAMRARGEAMVSFYHLVVYERDVSASASTLGLSDARLAEVRRAATAGDAHALRSAIGADFERATGISSSALDALVDTRAVRDPAMRAAFAAQYEHDHGVAFDPAHRDAGRMAETARHVALAHPELARALSDLGGDQTAATSLGHYLGVGDSAENLLGWHARAASSVCGEARFSSILASIDTTTSRSREVEDFDRALMAVAGISDLDGEARVGTLARIARMFHGSPTRTRAALFENGHFDAPRCRTRAELDALLDEMRSGRTWSDARLAEHVAQVTAERGAS